METRTTLQILLVAGCLAMVLLSILYLRNRKLSLIGYILWGLLALLVPLLGPFLVIACKPGIARTDASERLRRT